MKLRSTCWLILLIGIMACKSSHNDGPTTKNKATTTAEVYESAIETAMYPTDSKVYNKLFPVSKENKGLQWETVNGEEYVVMLSWKGDDTYYKPPYTKDNVLNTGSKWPIWVTAAPQLLNRMKKEKYTDANMRLKQLLGLPPNATYKYFVEFLVRPADLFRPCPDSEITDTKCDVCFPSTADSTYQAWINNTRISRYYACELYKQYPYTALGYTYDWNPANTSHVGLSEYVIKDSSNVIVKKIYTTEEYLKQE